MLEKWEAVFVGDGVDFGVGQERAGGVEVVVAGIEEFEQGGDGQGFVFGHLDYAGLCFLVSINDCFLVVFCTSHHTRLKWWRCESRGDQRVDILP